MATTQAIAAAREQTRASLSRNAKATSSATASASSTRSTAKGSRRCCSCRPGRSSTRDTGRCRSRTSRVTCRVRDVRRAGKRPFRSAAGARGVRRARVRRRRARRPRRDGDEAARCSSSLSLGAQRALVLAAEHPERVRGAAFIAPAVPLRRSSGPAASAYPFDEELDTDEGWAKYNQHYWLRDYRGFVEFFFSQFFTEPHSTKPIEDCVGWALETTAETLVATQLGRFAWQGRRCATSAVACSARCSSSTARRTRSPRRAEAIALAEADRRRASSLLEGSGHGPHVRDPVKVNLLLRDFIAPPSAGTVDSRQVAPQARPLHFLADRTRPRATRRRDRRRASQASP